MSRPFGDFVHPNEREYVVALALEAWPADSDLLMLETRFRTRGGLGASALASGSGRVPGPPDSRAAGRAAHS
jgi:hypothetical protein